MKLDSTDFELWGVPAQFAQDAAQLDARWKELQREAHPDRFAAQGAAAQRIAMQWSVRINEAYQRLKHPLRRAAYLCELHGVAVNAENNTAMPQAFLMQQMAWREALEEAGTADQLRALDQELRRTRQHTLDLCARLLDEAHDYAAAVQQVRALMFIERFAGELEDRIALLDAELSAARVRQAPAEQLRRVEGARQQMNESLQRVSYAHALLSL